MEFKQLILKSRSYRRFDGSVQVPEENLLELIDYLRFIPSASNLQRLRYVLSCNSEINARIYTTLEWAGYLSDWSGPEEPERPTAYVIITLDTKIRIKDTNAAYDVGIAAQTLLLAATEKGLGGCMFGSCKRKQLREILQLPEHLDICLVVALGKPVEKVVLEDAELGGSIKYYRDSDGTHHVPKRKREELVFRVYA